MAVKLIVTFYNIINYVSEIILDNIILIKERPIGSFRAKFDFYLFIFPDRRTLKFLKMKCNPSNEKTVAYFCNKMSARVDVLHVTRREGCMTAKSVDALG